jgi:hypothetical protein
MKVSEKITIRDIKQWNNNIITIKAGCGAGKSYFIKNVLYQLAKDNNKKILYLIHRKNCIDQFKTEIIADGKEEVIHIKSYQTIETLRNKRNQIFDFSQYQYIVCDEFHYFMSDATFNINTDISLDIILAQTQCCRIFMSATGDYIKNYINNIKKLDSINYELPISYNFINKLTFFNKDESMEKFIEEAIQKNDKGIFFIQSAQKAYNLYKKYKDYCLFNCSTANGKYYKHVDKDKINQMLTNQKFDELILITTTCFDAGANIIDENLKHIVVDVEDIGSLIQCLGRKRIQNKDDKIYLYIKTITNQQLGGKETQLKKKLQMADYFKEHTVKEYIEKYYKKYDKSLMVYDISVDETNKGTKKLNELMYFKCKMDIADIEIIKTYGKFGYCKYLAYLFGFEHYRLIEEDYMIDSLEMYLEQLIGKKLFKDEQKELIDKINLRVDGRQQKSYSKLNDGLKMINLNYVIVPKRNSDSRYWIIEKMEL